MLICALEDHSLDNACYLDLETGEIVVRSDYDLPGEKELEESLNEAPLRCLP